MHNKLKKCCLNSITCKLYITQKIGILIAFICWRRFCQIYLLLSRISLVLSAWAFHFRFSKKQISINIYVIQQHSSQRKTVMAYLWQLDAAGRMETRTHLGTHKRKSETKMMTREAVMCFNLLVISASPITFFGVFVELARLCDATSHVPVNSAK